MYVIDDACYNNCKVTVKETEEKNKKLPFTKKRTLIEKSIHMLVYNKNIPVKSDKKLAAFKNQQLLHELPNEV